MISKQTELNMTREDYVNEVRPLMEAMMAFTLFTAKRYDNVNECFTIAKIFTTEFEIQYKFED